MKRSLEKKSASIKSRSNKSRAHVDKWRAAAQRNFNKTRTSLLELTSDSNISSQEQPRVKITTQKSSDEGISSTLSTVYASSGTSINKRPSDYTAHKLCPDGMRGATAKTIKRWKTAIEKGSENRGTSRTKSLVTLKSPGSSTSTSNHPASGTFPSTATTDTSLYAQCSTPPLSSTHSQDDPERSPNDDLTARWFRMRSPPPDHVHNTLCP